MIVAVGVAWYEDLPQIVVGPFDSTAAADAWLGALEVPSGWRWKALSVDLPWEEGDPRGNPPDFVRALETGAESRTERWSRVRGEADGLVREMFTDAELSTNDPGICGVLDGLRLELRAGALEIADGLRDLARSVEAARRGE